MKTRSSNLLAGLLAALFAVPFCAQGQAAPPANPFRGKVALIAGFHDGSQAEASVRKFAAVYSDSHAHAFAFASKTRPGPDRFRVLDATGRIAYEGGDDKEAEAAVVNALTDMPPPCYLVAGVAWKNFKMYRKKFERLGTSEEGSALAPFRKGLKSTKPGVAEEAQAILDAVAKRHDSLIEDIEAERVSSPAEAYRDMMLFAKTWPSEKGKYAEAISAYKADPAVVSAYKALMAPKKRK